MDDGCGSGHIPAMDQISLVRCNAIAGYARNPAVQLVGDELCHFELDAGRIVGMMLRDRTDGDFTGIVFAPDRKLRFRYVAQSTFNEDPQAAFAAFAQVMQEAADAPAEAHYQDEDAGEPVDFFTPVHEADRLHPDFVSLISEEANSPARGIIEKMMRWYEDVDGNFIEQFQTTGFDQRIWELYLFATLVELGYVFDREQPMPDFVCTGLVGGFSLEAVTVAPTRQGAVIVPPPPRDTPEEDLDFVEQYMPIKFGSALYSKLCKRYWEKPHVAGRPFVLAVADFSSPDAMYNSAPSLERYLFGYWHEGVVDENGTLTIVPHKIEQHAFGGKTIPSGFFRIADAANVSAVVSSPAGDLSKFNRMGVLAGFGSGHVALIREGNLPAPDPNATAPLRFQALVNAPDYVESWVESMNVYHNPGAVHRLDPALMPGAAHHDCWQDGQVTSSLPEMHPFGTSTAAETQVDVASIVEEWGDGAVKIWSDDKWLRWSEFLKSRETIGQGT